MKTPPLCKQCKYCDSRAKDPRDWFCTNPTVGIRENPVDGSPLTVTCTVGRVAFDCGPDGKAWAPHDPFEGVVQ